MVSKENNRTNYIIEDLVILRMDYNPLESSVHLSNQFQSYIPTMPSSIHLSPYFQTYNPLGNLQATRQSIEEHHLEQLSSEVIRKMRRVGSTFLSESDSFQRCW